MITNMCALNPSLTDTHTLADSYDKKATAKQIIPTFIYRHIQIKPSVILKIYCHTDTGFAIPSSFFGFKACRLSFSGLENHRSQTYAQILTVPFRVRKT